MKFIAAHAEHDAGGLRLGVQPIRRVLAEHGCPIAPSTYYAARAAQAQPSQRALCDEQLKVDIARVHAQNYGVYGARKVRLALNREGIAVARCTVERLMGELGPPARNRTWVADFERHEALLNRVEVGDLHRRAVAAVR